MAPERAVALCSLAAAGVAGLGLTWRALVPQELPLTLPLAAAGAVSGLPAMALLVLVVEAARVEVARALPGGEQVPGSLALVDSELARRILDALPLLQKPQVPGIKHAAGVRSGAGNPLARAGKGERLSGPARRGPPGSLIGAHADDNQIPGNQDGLGDTGAKHGCINARHPG